MACGIFPSATDFNKLVSQSSSLCSQTSQCVLPFITACLSRDEVICPCSRLVAAFPSSRLSSVALNPTYPYHGVYL